ncbi:ComF family protein [Cohaesibacter haloalkalitolerans]|uniref:ComF family protein n=1 Tax=Cohaesibacter haloalkalitolerans TaxID=1162980 RepID=UPI000E6537D0|nr:ComF family protein [Cohaesibacter haloalkalitolerans]
MKHLWQHSGPLSAATGEEPQGGWSLAGSGRGAGKRLRLLARLVQDLIIPPRCAGCGKIVQDANSLCGTCWADMDWIAKPYCSVSGLPFSYDLGNRLVSPEVLAHPPVYDRARSVALFGSTARRMVHRLKYLDRTDLAGVMGRWMVRAGADCLTDPQALIVPVPLHRRRLWRRRYNQSALLAKAMAEETGLAFMPDLLVRTRPTRQQVGLNEAERRMNVEGAFQLNLPDRLSLTGRTVVLIDDVWTTGATLEACCRVLRRSNAGEICIITFARVAAGAEITI